jgi:hypothetical protein
MRISIFLMILIAAVASQSAIAEEIKSPICPLYPEWKLNKEVSDEFDGAALDKEKWWDFNPTMHGRKPAYFSRENVAVKDGLLLLSAKVQKPEERLFSYRSVCAFRFRDHGRLGRTARSRGSSGGFLRGLLPHLATGIDVS